MQLLGPAAGAAGENGRRKRQAGDDVKGFLIFLGLWVVITQFILPRFGVRPG